MFSDEEITSCRRLEKKNNVTFLERCRVFQNIEWEQTPYGSHAATYQNLKQKPELELISTNDNSFKKKYSF